MRHRNRLTTLEARVEAMAPKSERRELGDVERAELFLAWLERVGERLEREYGVEIWKGEGGWRGLVAELRQQSAFAICRFFFELRVRQAEAGVWPPIPPEGRRNAARFLAPDPIAAIR